MEWYEWFGPDRAPALDEISAFVDSPLWDQARSVIEAENRVAPRLEYSGCSLQKGWNIKYKKGGRSLCTLYPMNGYFIALVVIGNREELNMPELLPALGHKARELYQRTPFSLGGRWMMLQVKEAPDLKDLMALIHLRATS